MPSNHDDSAQEAASAHPYRPGVVRTIRKSFVDAWLYLAAFVAANVIWVIFFGLPASALGRLAANPGLLACVLGVTVASVSAGNAILFHVTNGIAHGEIAPRDFIAAVTEFFLRSLLLTVFLTVILAVGAFNVYFYFRIVSGPGWRVVGIVWGYIILMFAIAMLYCYPLLVEQRCGLFRAIKRSILLFLDNPGYTLGVAGALALWTIAVLVPILAALPVVIGLSALVLCFVQAGFVALVANNALLELLRKYESGEKTADAGGGMPGDTGR
jgi:uncharacterized membrane protein YesL